MNIISKYFDIINERFVKKFENSIESIFTFTAQDDFLKNSN